MERCSILVSVEKIIHFDFSTKMLFPSISINPKNSVISLFSKMQWAQNATECNVMPYNAECATLYLKTAGKRLGVSRIDFYGNRRYTGINGILTTEYEASDTYIFLSVSDIFVHYLLNATYSILSNSNRLFLSKFKIYKEMILWKRR